MDEVTVGVARDDVETLNVMTEVHLRGSGSPALAGASRVTADVSGLSQSAVRSAAAARDALDGVMVLGPTRFALPKRLLLRLAPLFTHKLVIATRALSDALEAVALVQRDQVAYVQRMNDSARALVVSGDLAISDAVDRLEAVSAEGGAAQSQALEAQVTLLGARVVDLEARLVAAQEELTRVAARVGAGAEPDDDLPAPIEGRA
ncbi:MAG: hypothetical protein HGA44_18160 [Cellulomonadaceae bacterium]|nr:hypothetical protein [Cellulomonadaceae bacterium]